MHLFGQPSGCNSAHQEQAAYSSGASSLPMLGKQRAPFWFMYHSYKGNAVIVLLQFIAEQSFLTIHVLCLCRQG